MKKKLLEKDKKNLYLLKPRRNLENLEKFSKNLWQR